MPTSSSAKLERIQAVLIETFCGRHHVYWNRFKVEVFDQASYTFLGDCSTFDSDLLTRLVVAAHAHSVRVEVRPGGRYLKLWMSARTRRGAMHERHPTLEENLARMNFHANRDEVKP